MAGVKHNDSDNNTTIATEGIKKGQQLSLNHSHSKIDECYNNGVLCENDKHFNHIASAAAKSLDPIRKKMFKITSVKKGGSGAIVADNDADSVDGLDESQTEDFSSELNDSSKATDLEFDLQDYLNIPLSPDEMASTTILINQQKPDQNLQSRFKVVKIETKEPFRRGKWICYDFYDTSSGTVNTLEKNDTKATEDNGSSTTTLLLSDNISSSNSAHSVQNINGSSSSTFIFPVAPLNPVRTEGHPSHSDVFVPIQPAPANQVLSQLDTLSSDVMAPFIAQQVLMSVAGVPSSSNSFHNISQSVHPPIIQSLPHSNIFPYDRNVPTVGLFQNGLPTGQSSEGVNLPSDTMLVIVGSGASPVLTTTAPAFSHSSMVHNQALTISNGLSAPSLQSQTQMASDAIVPLSVSLVDESLPNSTSGLAHVSQCQSDITFATGLDFEDQQNSLPTESFESIKTLQGVSSANSTESLKEAVEAVGGMYMELDNNENDPDEGEVSAAFPARLHERPNAIPFFMDRHRVDSPIGFCLTPIGSLCASPVFLEHYDPMAGMLPVRVGTPALQSPIAGLTNYVCNPAVLTAVNFPPSNPFTPSTYYPTPQSLVFSSGSAFVPQSVSGPCTVSNPIPVRKAGPSVTTVAMSCGVSVPQRLASTILQQMSTSKHTRLTDSPAGMSSLSIDSTSNSTSCDSDSLQDEVDGKYNLSHTSVNSAGPPSSLTLPLENSDGSSVAIDNKIEQAMDLVKRHLMYAVREEVEILKQQIGELMERIGQLEYENTVLRSEAKPETLKKLLQVRVSQTSQTSSSTQPSSLVMSPSSQQFQQTISPVHSSQQPAQATISTT